MNILFLNRTYNIGGVNVVTQYLAEQFMRDGHHICIFTLNGAPVGMEKRYNKKLRMYEGGGKILNFRVLMMMRKAIRLDNIDIIINNWGLRPLPVLMFKLAQVGLGKKANIISIYHNDPTTNGLLQHIAIIKEQSNCKLKRLILCVAIKLVTILSAWKFRICYKYSNRFVLLSESFIKPFIEFAGIKNSSKVRVISNPITIEKGDFKFDQATKRKELLYVGRLDEWQKRVSRVIDVWSLMEENNPDWSLVIVGDGSARKDLERLVNDYSLNRVSFEGYQQPQSYYERGSILLLTSEFEGFGLVIIEGMQYGVVPVVYGSYPAVFDIIEDQKDGVIIPYKGDKFDTNEVAHAIEKIIVDEERRRRMAVAGMKSSYRFSMESISKQWYNLFGEFN